MRHKAIAVLLAVTGLTACGSTAPRAASGELVGYWAVTAVVPSNSNTLVVEFTRNHPFVDFHQNGTVNGFDSVNNWSGSFVSTGSTVRLRNVSSTLVGIVSAAPSVVLDTTNAFHALTSGRPIHVEVDGRTMTLECGTFTLRATREPT